MAKDKKKKNKKSKAESMVSARSQVLNIVFIVAILVVTFIFLYNSLMNDPNAGLDKLHASDLLKLDWWWLIPAALCLVLSVGFLTLSLYILCRMVGYRRRVKQNIVYAAADIYFSAITPSASGGQPATAYYMTKSGIPLSLSTAVLMLNVTIYTVGLLTVSAIALIADFGTFLDFNGWQKFCVIFGIAYHTVLTIACVTCMVSRRVVYFLGDVVFGLLAKLRIVKDKDAKIAAFRQAADGYREAFGIIKRHPWLIPVLFINGFLQRAMLAPITYFVFLAMAPLFGGAALPSIGEVIIMQFYCFVGASAIPLPGGMGIAETLFNGMFAKICSVDSLRVLAMFLSRTFSSYLSIITCGTITMTHHIRMKRAEFRRRAIDSHEDPIEPEAPTASHDGIADADISHHADAQSEEAQDFSLTH